MKLALGSIAVGALVVGCATMETPRNEAVADLAPTAGNSARGTVTFTQKDETVLVVAKVSGLTPGNHGFHIHEKGDCSAPDAMSAGGHFNPTKMAHGGPTDQMRHSGDLGNLVADEQGIAKLEWVDPMMKLSGPNSIIGHAVIVHAKEDDLKTQPTGNAGGREACGVIGITK